MVSVELQQAGSFGTVLTVVAELTDVEQGLMIRKLSIVSVVLSLAAASSAASDPAPALSLPDDIPPLTLPTQHISLPKSICCPPTLCDRKCRGWTAQVGALVMFRANSDAHRFITDPTAVNSGVDAGDFRFGAQAGIEATLIAHDVVAGRDVEFRYLGVDGWSDSLFARITGDPFQINTTPPTFVSGPRNVFSTYKSSLQSFEVNLRESVWTPALGARINFLAGFRHLRIDESIQNRLASTATPPISTEHFNVSTGNNLYGLQLGFDSVVSGNCHYCFEAFGKAGVYANDSSHRSTLANEVTTPPTVFRSADTNTDVAFAVEAGLNLTYRLNSCTSCYLGYRAMWVDGLSLASNQTAHTGFGAARANVATDDDIIYHGLRCGFEFAF